MKHVMNQDKGKQKREMTYGDVAYLYVSLFIALVKITVYPILVVVAVGVMLIPLFIFNYLFSDYIYWKEASAIFYIVLVIVVVVFVFLHRRKKGRARQKIESARDRWRPTFELADIWKSTTGYHEEIDAPAMNREFRTLRTRSSLWSHGPVLRAGRFGRAWLRWR